MHTGKAESPTEHILPILTACLCQQPTSLRQLIQLTGLSKESLQPTLQALEKDALLQGLGRRQWQITAAGQTWFYSTLNQVQDVLVPAKEAPTLPFTVQTDWRECVCLNYRVCPERLQSLISPVFAPVVFEGKGAHEGECFGMVSVTISSIIGIRPRGMPAILGQNFCNVSYRAVVSFQNAAGERRVGYEFIKSITNSALFTTIGNLLPEYKFHDFETGLIHFLRRGDARVVGVELPGEAQDIVAAFDTKETSVQLPEDSIFSSKQDFDQGVIDLNDAFGYVKDDPCVYVLRIDRDPWRYRFVTPRNIYSAFFQEDTYFGPDTATLDSIIHCENIGYRWVPLIKETLQK